MDGNQSTQQPPHLWGDVTDYTEPAGYEPVHYDTQALMLTTAGNLTWTSHSSAANVHTSTSLTPMHLSVRRRVNIDDRNEPADTNKMALCLASVK